MWFAHMEKKIICTLYLTLKGFKVSSDKKGWPSSDHCNLIFFMYLTGKLRSLIPYQPQYKRPEQNDEEANHSQCHHCDNQIRQVSKKKGFLFWIQCFCVAFECYVLLTYDLLCVLKKKMLKFLTNSNTSCIKKKSRIWDLQNTLAKFISLQIIIFRYFFCEY